MINQLLALSTIGQPTPEVGMAATILMWGDRHAATITDVKTDAGATVVTTRDDTARCVKGSAHDGSAEYEYSPNPSGRQRHFKSTGPDGKWFEVRLDPGTGRWGKLEGGGAGLRIGEREEYQDPSF